MTSDDRESPEEWNERMKRYRSMSEQELEKLRKEETAPKKEKDAVEFYI